MDRKSLIKGSVKAWRAAFPCACAVNVKGRQDIVDADFVHIRGDASERLHTLIMQGCKTVTDAAFVHLRGIYILDMSDCSQVTITDADFVHLRGIHCLMLNSCNQQTISDVAFFHLSGIHGLYMFGCNQMTITDAAFVHLNGIHTLEMSFCNQITITDAAFGDFSPSITGCDGSSPLVLARRKGRTDALRFYTWKEALRFASWPIRPLPHHITSKLVQEVIGHSLIPEWGEVLITLAIKSCCL